MYKLFVFAAILAFAFAVPNPEPNPQVLVSGVPAVASVVSPGLAIPAAAQYTVSGVVAPVVAAPGVVIV